MNIWFRVDANAAVGSGHLMRCLALAQVFRKYGDQVTFASTNPLPRIAAEPAMTCFSIDAVAGSDADAEALAAASCADDAQWIVIDGYQFTTRYQEIVRAGGRRILCIDDHGHAGRYVADLILDQNITADRAAYRSSENALLLLGTNFVLLREEFGDLRNWRREFPARVRKILVTFGGADLVNATTRVVEALSKIEGVEITAVLGPQNRALLSDSAQIRVVRDAREMPQLMSECDLAIAGAGSTCWELAFLQTPMLVLAIADNQKPIAKALATAGAAIDLGEHVDLSSNALYDSLAQVLDNPERRRVMGAAAHRLVDGEGAARVAAHIKKTELTLRAVCADDGGRIFEWANEPVTRAASFHVEPISWEDHCCWFEARLADSKTRFYIAETKQPVGMVRFQSDGDETVISIALDLTARGSGLGAALIIAGCERFFAESDVSRVRALIKPANETSLRVFSRAGFVQTKSALQSKIIREELHLDRAA